MTAPSDLGTFTRRGDVVDLRYERFYPRPIETVWAAFTQEERLADWIGSALVEPHAGGRYELFTGRPRRMTGRILTWQPPHLLEFSWDTGDAPPNRVRVELSAADGGTRMTSVSTFESLEQMEQVIAMGIEEGLRGAMGQIDAILAEG